MTDELKAPCPKCAGLNGACSMNCPTLQLPADWAELTPAQKYGNPE